MTKTETPRQLSLDLPARPALGREDFLVAPSNAMAVTMIENPGTWGGTKLALTGPAGSGKTHLAHVWAAHIGARIVQAQDLRQADLPALASGPVAVEDVPEISNDRHAQEALFHLHNLTQAEGQLLLLTGRPSVPQWHLELPDLASRVDAAARARLDAPDDALLTAVLAKLFADRQLVPRQELISYLIRRMDRSFNAARALVAALDAASLAQKKPISRGLAAQVLDNLQGDGR